MTVNPKFPLWAWAAYVAAVLVISFVVFAIFAVPGCGKRSCEPGECFIICDENGEEIGSVCPDSCQP